MTFEYKLGGILIFCGTLYPFVANVKTTDSTYFVEDSYYSSIAYYDNLYKPWHQLYSFFYILVPNIVTRPCGSQI